MDNDTEEINIRGTVRHEFHSYHVTEERDMGILNAGFAKGHRLITTKTACADSYEEAERLLAAGKHTLTGYQLETP